MASTCDPIKDAKNREKHGISLARFDDMVDRLAVAAGPSAERRAKVLGRIEAHVYAAVITWRPAGVRVISLRRASRQERKEYVRVYPTSK